MERSDCESQAHLARTGTEEICPLPSITNTLLSVSQNTVNCHLVASAQNRKNDRKHGCEDSTHLFNCQIFSKTFSDMFANNIQRRKIIFHGSLITVISSPQPDFLLTLSILYLPYFFAHDHT